MLISRMLFGIFKVDSISHQKHTHYLWTKISQNNDWNRHCKHLEWLKSVNTDITICWQKQTWAESACLSYPVEQWSQGNWGNVKTSLIYWFKPLHWLPVQKRVQFKVLSHVNVESSFCWWAKLLEAINHWLYSVKNTSNIDDIHVLSLLEQFKSRLHRHEEEKHSCNHVTLSRPRFDMPDIWRTTKTFQIIPKERMSWAGINWSHCLRLKLVDCHQTITMISLLNEMWQSL